MLEVHTFDIKGSIAEDQWGKPSDIELHSDVRIWVDGLRRGGGGGCVKVLFAYMFSFLNTIHRNVLKLRKLEQSKAVQGEAQETTRRSPAHNTFNGLLPARKKTRSKKQPMAFYNTNERTTEKSGRGGTNSRPGRAREQKWRVSRITVQGRSFPDIL